ncbi:MAG: hypothetical protein HY917_01555 [Candidatus Diapherotrites archaeon]|nr:hypothetical protein [Candidatus Diapherotrites archaeon]
MNPKSIQSVFEENREKGLVSEDDYRVYLNAQAAERMYRLSFAAILISAAFGAITYFALAFIGIPQTLYGWLAVGAGYGILLVAVHRMLAGGQERLWKDLEEYFQWKSEKPAQPPATGTAPISPILPDAPKPFKYTPKYSNIESVLRAFRDKK